MLHALDWDYVEHARGSNKHGRQLARPCLYPVVLGMEPLGGRGWGWAARDTA